MDCGPRCWRYVEKLNGRRATLKHLLELCGTTTDGTYIPNMVVAGEALNYACVVRENMTWRQLQSDLRRGRHVIAVWWSVINAGVPSKPEGHYSVIKAVTRNKVWLYDPEAEDVIILPREMWLSHWWSWEHPPAGERKDYVRTAIVARKKS